MTNHKTCKKAARNKGVGNISGAGHPTNAKRRIVLQLLAAVCFLSVLVPALLYATNIIGTNGNDTLIYTQTQNVGSSDTYDGGVGTDTLVLKLTAAQANADAADIAAAQAFIAASRHRSIPTDQAYSALNAGPYP
jgi:Ca2+-binding RTX toxin-like protein